MFIFEFLSGFFICSFFIFCYTLLKKKRKLKQSIVAIIVSAVCFIASISFSPKESDGLIFVSGAIVAAIAYFYYIKKGKEEIKKARQIETQVYLERNRQFLDNKKAEFKSELDSIPFINVELSKESVKRKRVDDLDVNYANITKRTNVNTISDFVAIDIETTGLSLRDEILEISAIKFFDFEPIEQFHTFLKPKNEISKEITAINGIRNEDVENAPTISEVIPSLNEFIKGKNIVAQNVKFDVKFLHVNGVDILPKTKCYDTWQLSKKVIDKSDVVDFKLDSLCRYYSIYPHESHKANADCYAAALVFKNIVNDIMN